MNYCVSHAQTPVQPTVAAPPQLQVSLLLPTPWPPAWAPEGFTDSLVVLPCPQASGLHVVFMTDCLLLTLWAYIHTHAASASTRCSMTPSNFLLYHVSTSTSVSCQLVWQRQCKHLLTSIHMNHLFQHVKVHVLLCGATVVCPQMFKVIVHFFLQCSVVAFSACVWVPLFPPALMLSVWFLFVCLLVCLPAKSNKNLWADVSIGFLFSNFTELIDLLSACRLFLHETVLSICEFVQLNTFPDSADI